MGWADLAFSLRTGVQHRFDTPRAWTDDLVPRSSMEILNVTLTPFINSETGYFAAHTFII